MIDEDKMKCLDYIYIYLNNKVIRPPSLKYKSNLFQIGRKYSHINAFSDYNYLRLISPVIKTHIKCINNLYNLPQEITRLIYNNLLTILKKDLRICYVPKKTMDLHEYLFLKGPGQSKCLICQTEILCKGCSTPLNEVIFTTCIECYKRKKR